MEIREHQQRVSRPPDKGSSIQSSVPGCVNYGLKYLANINKRSHPAVHSSWKETFMWTKVSQASTQWVELFYWHGNMHQTLPMVEETLDALSGEQWFSTMDLANGYNQVFVAEGDRYKSAFCTPFVLFQFNWMPIGLCNVGIKYVNHCCWTLISFCFPLI